MLAACALTWAGAACESDTPSAAEPEARWDLVLPPIDAPPTGGRPADYKGLPLALVDNGAPVVSPVRGVIGVVCVGMSNAAQECSTFAQRLAMEWSGTVAASVRFANCAVGSHAIERWNDSAYDATLWDACKAMRLPTSGIAPDQVVVLYHKAANQFTTGPGGVPLPLYPHPSSDYEAFRRNLARFASRVPIEFPSVRAVYTSSRSYGGFALSTARGEPLSYEEGHALNTWLAEHDSVDGVWHGWGPYLWAPACGFGVTNGGGVCYERADYVDDGVHPSTAGRTKISSLMHARFLREAWYRP